MAESKAKPDRKADLRTNLVAADIDLAKFVELCWDSPDVDRINFYKPGAGAGLLPERMERGFPPADAEAFVREMCRRYAVGRLQLAPHWVPDGRYVTQRVFMFGDLEEPAVAAVAAAGSAAADGGKPALDTGVVMKALTEELKGMGVLETYKDFLIQKQDAAAAREMKPIEVLANIVTGLLAAKSHAPAADPEVAALRAEVAAMQRQQLEALQKKIEALEARAVPALPGDVADIASQIEKVTAAARLLGLGKTDTTAVASVWTPDGIAAMFTAAAPMIDKTLDRLERLRGPAGAPAALPERTDSSGPTGRQEDIVKLAPEDRKMVELLFKSLEDRDWHTVLPILEESIKMAVHAKTNVAYYMLTLQKIDLRFAEYQGHMLEFLKWVGEERAQEQGPQ